MDHVSFFDELVKLGAISDEEARKSLNRLETLEQSKSTPKRMLSDGAIGGLAGVATGAAANLIESGKAFKGGRPSDKLRNAAANAARGAIGAGGLRVLQNKIDRTREAGTLKKYVHERSSDD